MRFANTAFLAGILTTFLVGFPRTTAAQECRVESGNADAYMITLDGERYFAISRSAMEDALSCRTQLSATADKLRQCEALVAAAEDLSTEQQQSITQLKQHVATLDAQNADLKEEVQRLKTMLGMSTLSFEAGIGANDDSKATGLLGVGYGPWRLWGYASDGGTTGVMFGRQFGMPSM